MSPTLIIYWFKLTLKIRVKSEMVEFLADFGGFTPLFCQKIGFWLRGVKNFVTNFDHLLVLAYPENKFEPNLSWLSFALIFFGGGGIPPFFAKNQVLAQVG